jgi:hypothetical protein
MLFDGVKMASKGCGLCPFTMDLKRNGAVPLLGEVDPPMESLPCVEGSFRCSNGVVPRDASGYPMGSCGSNY